MGLTRPLEGKRVLVVDDNYLIGEGLCAAIRGAGAVPIGPVGRAAEAIRVAEQEELDGVLLEVRLHERDDGMQVAEYLRAKAVPIVLVTGYDRADLDPRLEDLPYLSKPPLPADLVEQAAAAFGATHRRDQ